MPSNLIPSDKVLPIAEEGYKPGLLSVDILSYYGDSMYIHDVVFQFKEEYGQLIVIAQWPDIDLDSLYDFKSETDKLASIREDILITLSEAFQYPDRLINLTMIGKL